MTGASFNRGASRQDVGTPREVLQAVEARFGRIWWDLAAHPENRVTDDDRYYGPGSKHGENSLEQDWSILRLGGRWLNPPFANIAPWAEKCAKHRFDKCFTFLLVPASVGANWYSEHVHMQCLELYLSPRLTFVGSADPYPKDLALFVYGYGISGAQPWNWRQTLCRHLAAASTDPHHADGSKSNEAPIVEASGS
jgi:phage N-6-adenine-methyltransferase